jgi:hypothetical protein
LEPSDFYLFSHVKHCLRRQSFETADELALAIPAVLRGIEKWTLHEVTILRELKKFRGWNQFCAVDVEMLMVR